MCYFEQPKYTSLHTYACRSMRVLCKRSQTQWLIPLATASHHKHFFFLKMYSLCKKNLLFPRSVVTQLSCLGEQGPHSCGAEIQTPSLHSLASTTLDLSSFVANLCPIRKPSQQPIL